MADLSLARTEEARPPFDGFQFFTLLHAQFDDRGYSHSRKVAELL